MQDLTYLKLVSVTIEHYSRVKIFSKYDVMIQFRANSSKYLRFPSHSQ